MAIDTFQKTQFIGDIIEIFEEFLEERGIVIDNPEKQDAIDDGEDEASIANIYGTDYGNLEEELEYLLNSWKIIDYGF